MTERLHSLTHSLTHNRLNEHEFEQTPGDSEGRGPGMLQSMGSRTVGHE